MTDIYDNEILESLRERGVTRLAHFTPARNLPHIIADRQLRSVADMAADVRAAYASTDPSRLDGEPDKLCCSIEYPNAFYFRNAKAGANAANYPDWACLLLRPELAARRGSLFCPRNASAQHGTLLRGGIEGLKACYAQNVLGARGAIYPRGPNHRRSSPTDVQAEVLVPTPVPLDRVLAVVMPTAAHVRQEIARLSRLQLDASLVRWAVSSDLFEVNAVTAAIRSSADLQLHPWDMLREA